MKHYNKKLEITRVYKHFVLEWEDKDAAEKQYRNQSSIGWAGIPTSTSGTEIYDDKEDLLKRIESLL